MMEEKIIDAKIFVKAFAEWAYSGLANGPKLDPNQVVFAAEVWARNARAAGINPDVIAEAITEVAVKSRFWPSWSDFEQTAWEVRSRMFYLTSAGVLPGETRLSLVEVPVKASPEEVAGIKAAHAEKRGLIPDTSTVKALPEGAGSAEGLDETLSRLASNMAMKSTKAQMAITKKELENASAMRKAAKS